MQRSLASEDLCQTIITIIVQPWSGAARAKCRVVIAARPLKVLARNVHRDPEASRQHDAHWPDFNVKFIDLIRDEWLLVVVRVIRPVRKGLFGIKFTVRGTQPSLS